MWHVAGFQLAKHHTPTLTHTRLALVCLPACRRVLLKVSLFTVHFFFGFFLLCSQSIFVLLWFLAICSLIVVVFVFVVFYSISFMFCALFLTATPSFLNNFKCYELLEKVIKKLQRLRASHSLSLSRSVVACNMPATATCNKIVLYVGIQVYHVYKKPVSIHNHICVSVCLSSSSCFTHLLHCPSLKFECVFVAGNLQYLMPHLCCWLWLLFYLSFHAELWSGVYFGYSELCEKKKKKSTESK